MSIKQAYLGRIEAQAWEFVAGATTYTLTAGEYYPRGYTGEATSQLVEHLTALLEPRAGTPVVSVSLTTGLVTINWDGTATTVTWTDTELRDILGFTGNLTSATSHVSTYPMRYLWLPSVAPSGYPTTVDDIWEPRSNSRVIASPDGSSHGRRGYESNLATLTYDLLPAADVVHHNATYDSEDNGTFRSFFRNVAHNVMPIRVLPDATTYAASTDYVTALFGRGDGEALGRYTDYAGPSEPTNYTLWDVAVPLVEHDEES